MSSLGHPQQQVNALLGFLPACGSSRGGVLNLGGDEVARLPQDVLPVFHNERFLSRNRVRFPRLVVFLGLHFRALVFYSYGEIFAHRFSLNVGGFPESEATHGF